MWIRTFTTVGSTKLGLAFQAVRCGELIVAAYRTIQPHELWQTGRTSRAGKWRQTLGTAKSGKRRDAIATIGPGGVRIGTATDALTTYACYTLGIVFTGIACLASKHRWIGIVAIIFKNQPVTIRIHREGERSLLFTAGKKCRDG